MQVPHGALQTGASLISKHNELLNGDELWDPTGPLLWPPDVSWTEVAGANTYPRQEVAWRPWERIGFLVLSAIARPSAASPDRQV